MVAVAVEGPYTYRVGPGQRVGRGSIVEVSLGPRATLGVVWGPSADQVAHNRLKDIGQVFDLPALSMELLETIAWVARYTLAPPGMVVRAVLRSREALEPERPVTGYRLAGPPPERMTDARRRVLEVLEAQGGAEEGGEGGLAWRKPALVGESGVSASVIEGLVKAGTLEKVSLPPSPAVLPPDPDHAPARLSAQQAAALERWRASRAQGKRVALLDGVTGSGKTEVFFEAVADCLRQGKQALILLPEIALTHAFMERFAARFGVRAAEWHSDMTPARRARVWRAVLSGTARVVVGARSALFLPFSELGLIVLDEEHDGAFKQSEGMNYHGRDMAIVRASKADANVILSSATPSVESRNNANLKRYAHIVIGERFSGTSLPDILAIDMREEGPKRGQWIAPRLARDIFATIDRGEQVLLFLNRRGYAPLTLCRACGYKYQCPDCAAWMVEHRFRGVLACHYCGREQKRPEACVRCGTEGALVPIGPGIERIAEEVTERFPDARTVVLSSDMGSNVRLRDRFAEIAAGKHDLIIGTQLVAKGHHFEKLTLVGVLDADLGLAHGDPRAAEKTFQLLTQVTGRAGRAARSGRAYLQTYHPDNAVIAAMVSGDREGFYAHELAVRKEGRLPPFGRLAALIVSASEHSTALDHARHLLAVAPKAPDLNLFGPADAPVAMVRGRHRVRLLVQSQKGFDLSGYVRFWLSGAKKPTGNLKVRVDIDPVTFY